VVVNTPSHEERIAALEAAGIRTDARLLELMEEVDGLHKAMEHRAVIEQAKGVIMSSMGCGPEAAFAMLIAQSQVQNRKLWQIASEIAALQDRTEED
jgi:AmiR/NasT family two-component response regulator